jgi:putative glycosyltransferase (TIGR04372 family)
MGRKNRFFRYITNINREGLHSYVLSRSYFLYSISIHPFIRQLRYRLVGLLHGYRFQDDIVRLSQLEYLCEEIYRGSHSIKSKSENQEVESLLSRAKEYLLDEEFVEEGLLLLKKARSLDPDNPSLLKVYGDYTRNVHLVIGFIKGLWDEAQIATIELERRRYSNSCFNPFESPTKVLEQTWAGNIGHLGLLAKLIQAKQLRLMPENNHVLLVSRAANNCYLDYLDPFPEINVLPREMYKKFHDSCFLPYSERLDMWETNHGYENLYSILNRVEREWQSKRLPPLLTIESNHKEKGLRVLEDLSIPADAWFVSLHVRSGGSGKNNLRDGRNCDIDSYIPAIQAITDAGGYVFRMGDPSMKPLPELPQVIDYALSPHKSDWMDVFLWACCRFFIGTNSGPTMIPPTFGVPQLWTNATPFAMCSIPFANSLMIPKLWYSQSEQRLLSFSEMLDCPAGWCERRTIGDDLVLVDNSAEELEAGVKEMLELTRDGIQDYQYDIVKDPSNPLQMKLDEIREKYKTFGKLPVSRTFLNKYADLIN